jgi:hypothetical protein
VSSPIKLVPRTPTANQADDGDKVASALNKASDILALDVEAGMTPKGVVIIFWREFPDGTAEESWITAGFNQLEAVGLLTKTIHDIQSFSLDGFNDDENLEDPA